MKKILLLIATVVLSTANYAQNVYKGNGTSNSTFLFGYTSYAAKSQCIYEPSVLTNLRSGQINRLYWRYGNSGINNPQILYYFTIKLGQTPQTSFTGNNFFTGLQEVKFDSAYTIQAGVSGNWFAIDLDTTFAYDSTQTLIVQLTFPTSAIDNWGTYGTSNSPVRKLISPDTAAVTGDGSSSTWQDFGFDLMTPTGIYTLFNTEDAFDFIVSPNPVNDKITIQPLWKENEKVVVAIFNQLGQQVFQQTFSPYRKQIDISFLPDGIYSVAASSDKYGTVTKRILKNRSY